MSTSCCSLRRISSPSATLELLADTPAQERIAAGEADFAAGNVLDERQVRALIGERHRAQTVQVLDLSHRRDAYRLGY